MTAILFTMELFCFLSGERKVEFFFHISKLLQTNIFRISDNSAHLEPPMPHVEKLDQILDIRLIGAYRNTININRPEHTL